MTLNVHELTPNDRPRLEATLAFLMQNEPLHCIQLGLFLPFANGTSGTTRWWVAGENGSVRGVVSRTGELNPIISLAESEAVIRDLANRLHGAFPDLPGVMGPKESARQFAQAWEALTGTGHRVEMNEGVYECREVIFPERMDGTARFANELDVAWMVPWMEQFHDETGIRRLADELESNIRHKLATGGFVLWLDDAGTVVSMAGYGNPTPNGMRIGPVYTPVEYRNRGYAAAVTALATKHLLDAGRGVVFLFTDLANPASNHVYRKIGYQQVGDVTMYQFGQDS